MSNLTSKAWWAAAGTRAIKTAAQTAVGVIGGSVALGDVNWVLVGSAAALASIVSLLTSLAGLPEVATATETTPTAAETAPVETTTSEKGA